MALTSQGFVLTVTLVDNGGNVSNLSYALTSANFTEAGTDSATILAALAGVTDAVVKAYNVGERFKESALTLPGTGIQVENTAVLSALITGEVDKWARIVIPAPKPAIFVGLSGAAANQIDPTDTEVQAYVSLFDATGEATISDGETVQAPSASTLNGKRVHRGSRRG